MNLGGTAPHVCHGLDPMPSSSTKTLPEAVMAVSDRVGGPARACYLLGRGALSAGKPKTRVFRPKFWMLQTRRTRIL